MPEGKNRTLLFWRHQLVFIVSKKKKKQRLSNRSKPLTWTCLIGSGWFALSFIDLIAAFIFRDSPPPPPPPPCLSRLSPHLPLYHWLVVCNLFVLLCCHFLCSDGFLQIWSPWPLLAPLANTFFFFFTCLPTCYQHLFPLPVALAPASLARSLMSDGPESLAFCLSSPLSFNSVKGSFACLR